MSSSSGKQPCRVTYIWIAGRNSHHDIRSKDRAMYLTKDEALQSPKDLLASGVFPVWNFDGSSTGQAAGVDTEVLLKPVNAFPCHLPRSPVPLAHGTSTSCSPTSSGCCIPWIVVLAECYLPDGRPTRDNTRAAARQIFEQQLDEHPWFGLEQEFFLVDRDGRPYGWPAHGFPAPQGPYYCSTGSHVAFGRAFIDAHYETCLSMGLNISGTNAEVTPGQWEFQVGPCEGIEMGDQLTIARWVLLRLLEDAGLDVDYRAKPVRGDWNGSGLHCNFSTASTRAPGGLDVIHQYIERLRHTVRQDIVFYGSENNERLTGKHETSKANEFSYGVGTRGTSIRIPNSVASERRGYMEDRRPAGDADPYLLTSRLFASCVDIASPLLDLASPTYEQEWMRRAFDES